MLSSVMVHKVSYSVPLREGIRGRQAACSVLLAETLQAVIASAVQFDCSLMWGRAAFQRDSVQRATVTVSSSRICNTSFSSVSRFGGGNSMAFIAENKGRRVWLGKSSCEW